MSARAWPRARAWRAIVALGLGLMGSWLVASQPSGAADSAVILQYHRFGEGDLPSTNVTMAQLKAHIAHLEAGGYAVLPVPEIVDALRARRPLPERAVGITIDDAARSVLTQAWPLLDAAGFPFTLFVSTDAVDQGHARTLSWDELRRLAAAGVAIGNHGSAHAKMWRDDLATSRADVVNAQARIRDELGIEPRLFAYPYGEWSLPLRALLEELGFEAAFGQQSGVAHADADRLALPRFALNEAYGGMERFRLVVDTLPLGAYDVTPRDPILIENPPAVGFSLRRAIERPDRLGCYASGGNDVTLEWLGAERVEVRFARPFPRGRGRLNCTLPGPGARWYWFGLQFVAPG